MTSAVCEVTKFPVSIEFKRRTVRRCSCKACETYAGMFICAPEVTTQPTHQPALLAA
jgi:hypothetical protein